MATPEVNGLTQYRVVKLSELRQLVRAAQLAVEAAEDAASGLHDGLSADRSELPLVQQLGNAQVVLTQALYRIIDAAELLR